MPSSLKWVSPSWAKKQAARVKRFRTEEPLLDFIPRVSKGYESPRHLKPYVDVLERAVGGNLRTGLAAPPQHCKTTTAEHAFVQWLQKYPHLRFAYATYNQTRADEVSNHARYIAEAAGLELAKGTTKRQWWTPQGGGLKWTSIGGSLTGYAVDGVLVVDDPCSGRKDAESAVKRQAFKDWWTSTGEPRLHPGASALIMATRYHPDDPTGFLLKDYGFQYINLKAIAENDCPEGDNRQPGEALWPDKRPLATLEARRVTNPWNFAGMYQGEPRPRGGKVFNEPARYDPESLPARGYRVAYGVDLAYSSKTSADWSVCVELWEHDGYVYVVGLDRHQVDAPSFTLTLKAKQANRRAGFFWYAAGVEKGAGSFIQAKGIPLNVMDPEGRDKYTRAIACAEAWNAGKVLVPDTDDDWVHTFVDEVCNFTGIKDANDDQVDALVAGFDGLPQTQVLTPTSGPGSGSRWGGSPGRGFG
jgi:predicted phage terminase large subunit-like protein